MRRCRVRVPNLLPSPKKIMKRGLYEMMWGAPQRIKKGKF